MQNKLLRPDLTTVNKMIRLISYTQGTFDAKKEQMMNKLKEIKAYGLAPNLSTFNNCLYILRSAGFNKNSATLALDILKEMELLKIGFLV